MDRRAASQLDGAIAEITARARDAATPLVGADVPAHVKAFIATSSTGSSG